MPKKNPKDAGRAGVLAEWRRLGFIPGGTLRPQHVAAWLESVADDAGGPNAEVDREVLAKCAAAIDAVLCGNCDGMLNPWRYSRGGQRGSEGESNRGVEVAKTTSNEMKLAIHKARVGVEAVAVAKRVEELVKSWDGFMFASKVAVEMIEKAGKVEAVKGNGRQERRQSKRKPKRQ